MTSRHSSIILCLLLLGGTTGVGQRKQQAPPFRSETELVTVDIVVADKHGEPVGDLKVEDFAIMEEGRPQRVQFFQPVTTGGQSRADRPPQRAYRYSTNVGAQAHAGRSFVLFFDDVHLSQEQGERAKRALEQFLNDEAQAGDLVSLVAPARALRWHARLPVGRAELVKVLASFRGSYQPDISTERVSDYEAYRIHVMQDEQMGERVARRFSNFRVAGRDQVNLQRDEGPRPENKGGTAGLLEPLVQSRAAEAYVRATARNRATLGALIETIAIDGSRARSEVGRADISRLHSRPGARSFQASGGCCAPREHRDVLRRCPGDRGAIGVWLGAVRIADRLARCGRGERRLYARGGRSGVARRDDRRLLRAEQERPSARVCAGSRASPRSITCSATCRRAGAPTVNSGASPSAWIVPTSRFALARAITAGGVPSEPGKRADHGRTDAFEIALDSPYDLGAVPVRTASYAFGATNAGEVSVLLAMETDLRSFDLKSSDGIATDVLDLRVLVTNPTTGKTKRYERAVEMRLQGGLPKNETSAWYPLSEALALVPGTYQARVAVRDRNSGRVGTVTHDFEVPVRKGMTLSSLIVTDTIEKPADGSGPPKAVLMVRRLLNAGATLYYQFMVLDAGRTAAGETRVRAGHVVRRADGGVVKELKPTPLVPGQDGMSRFAGISLAGLPAGDYDLVVTVIDEVRGETVMVDEAFAIAEPQHAKF